MNGELVLVFFFKNILFIKKRFNFLNILNNIERVNGFWVNGNKMEWC